MLNSEHFKLNSWTNNSSISEKISQKCKQYHKQKYFEEPFLPSLNKRIKSANNSEEPNITALNTNYYWHCRNYIKLNTENKLYDVEINSLE